MESDMPANEPEEERAETLRRLLQKFRDDSLSVKEAKELLGYIEEDLERAKEADDQEAERIIRRYKEGVESYIALREDSVFDVDLSETKEVGSTTLLK